MSRLRRDGPAESVSRDQILRREFLCSVDQHEQNWQPCPVDPYSCYMCVHIFLTKKLQTRIKMPNGWRTIKSLVHEIRLHSRRGKGMAESFSREKLRHATAERRWMRNPVRPSSCVTPAGTSNELDVQNEWEENTNTHTHTYLHETPVGNQGAQSSILLIVIQDV